MSNSSIIKQPSEISDNSDIQLVRDLYQRSKTDNIVHPVVVSNENNTIENSKNLSSQPLSNTKSPRIRINDEDRPLNQKLPTMHIKSPKNFDRVASQVINSVFQSLSDSESSLDDYTSKKGVKTMHESNQSSKKKIETLTLTESPIKVDNRYRNSKIISFGRKQNTQPNFTEHNEEKSIIDEEGEEKPEKNEEEGENLEINKKTTNLSSPKRNLLEITSPSPHSPPRTNKKSKLLENLNISSVGINNQTESLSPHSQMQDKFNSKLYKLISQFYIVKKFMTSLINATIYRKPKKLKELHYNMINDWSFFMEGIIKNRQDDDEHEKKTTFSILFDSFIKKFRNMQKKSKPLKHFVKIFDIVFHPTHLFKILWDIIHCLLIILFLIIIPLNISFNVNLLDYYLSDNPLVFSAFRTFCFCFFLIDIVINLNTAYYEKGELIKKRKEIFKNYVKKQLIWDILSIIYLYDKILGIPDVIPTQGFVNFIGLLFLLRISTMNKIVARIEEFVFIEEKLYNTFSLIRLICFVIFVSHYFACTWHYIAYERMDVEITWLNEYHLAGEVWLVKYLYSFYYVVIVMNTVGFGDLVPQNNTERLYSIFFIYVACGIFAYAINCIGLILQDINKKNNNLKRTILLINSYMKQKNINVDLRVRIRKYIEYIWQEERVQNEEETENIINKLSRTLKEELLLNGNGIILREFPLFYMNFSEDSLKKLVYHIKEVNLTPGDVVYSSNELDEGQCLYIVRKGEIELFIDTPRSFQQSVTILRTIKSNEMFGEYSFFSDMPRESSARSSSFTTLFVIKKEQFLSIIKSNSDDYEIYCQLKDRINLYTEVEGLYDVCPACQQNTHNVTNCTLLHLTLSKHRILQRYNYSQPQIRNKAQRRLKKNPNALKNYEKHENLAQKFSHDLNSEMSNDDDDSSDVSTTNIKLDIKKEFNRVSSDLTNDPAVNTVTQSPEEKVTTSASPKFMENQRKSILRFPSKIEYDSMISNNSINARKPRSSARKKPGTTVVASLQRQTSKDSMSKNNSIYSKKSSKSNKSIKFFPYELTNTQNTNEELRKLAVPKERRNSRKYSNISKYSNVSSNRLKYDSKYDEDLSEYMIYMKKDKNKNVQNISEHSSRSRSRKSKDSRSKNGSFKKVNENESTIAIEKPVTTILDIDKINYDDISKSYEFYFPYNNVENVVDKIRNDSLKKKKKKNVGRSFTKTDNFFINSSLINCEGLDLISKSNNASKFKRRGGRLEILKKTNFFKRKSSAVAGNNDLDKKTLMKILLNRDKINKKSNIISKIKNLADLLQTIILRGWHWLSMKFHSRSGKTNIVLKP